jgi:hypothetical protein
MPIDELSQTMWFLIGGLGIIMFATVLFRILSRLAQKKKWKKIESQLPAKYSGLTELLREAFTVENRPPLLNFMVSLETGRNLMDDLSGKMTLLKEKRWGKIRYYMIHEACVFQFDSRTELPDCVSIPVKPSRTPCGRLVWDGLTAGNNRKEKE